MGLKIFGESFFREFLKRVSRLSWGSCRKMSGGSWEIWLLDR